MPTYLNGQVPQMTWLYGNLDYANDKYHKHYQSHDDWYPDRKNKTLGNRNGGFRDNVMQESKYMGLKHEELPRGCQREVKKYNDCVSAKNKEACFNEKIGIMEVCPEHILSALKEKKKWFLRAQVIDNATYKRAMTVSPYNRGRSVSDLELKTWAHGTKTYLRPDSYWNDDRYDPTEYRHAFKYDNVNFPDIEYKDIFGGNWG